MERLSSWSCSGRTTLLKSYVGTVFWRDTALVLRRGSLTFRSRFVDYTGRFMLHCPMMNHEELGMMQMVEVYKDS